MKLSLILSAFIVLIATGCTTSQAPSGDDTDPSGFTGSGGGAIGAISRFARRYQAYQQGAAAQALDRMPNGEQATQPPSDSDSGSSPPETDSAPASASEPNSDTQREAVCGNPIRFPISEQCLSELPGATAVILRRKSDLVMEVWRECPHYETPEERYLALKANLKRWGLENSAFGYRAIAEGEAQARNSRSRMPPRPCVIAAVACVSNGDPLDTPCAERDAWCHAYRSEQEDEYNQTCAAKAISDPACQSLSIKQQGSSGRKRQQAETNACMKAIDAACDPPASACVQAKTRLDDFYDEIDRARFENALHMAFPPPAVSSPAPNVYIESPPIVIHDENPPPAMSTHTDCEPFGTGISCHTVPGP